MKTRYKFRFQFEDNPLSRNYKIVTMKLVLEMSWKLHEHICWLMATKLFIASNLGVTIEEFKVCWDRRPKRMLKISFKSLKYHLKISFRNWLVPILFFTIFIVEELGKRVYSFFPRTLCMHLICTVGKINKIT